MNLIQLDQQKDPLVPLDPRELYPLEVQKPWMGKAPWDPSSAHLIPNNKQEKNPAGHELGSAYIFEQRHV